jgi:AraC-like DNA-binding protein
MGFYSSVLAIITQLLVMISRHLKRLDCREKKIQSSKIKRIRDIMSYLEERAVHERLTLEVVAAKYGISRFYLCRLFKEVTGITFVRYITSLKVNEAKRLLVDTDMSMIEISESVGYESLSNFEKNFKTETGIIPSKYRRIIRSDNKFLMQNILGQL